jgi:hypothetical protein
MSDEQDSFMLNAFGVDLGRAAQAVVDDPEAAVDRVANTADQAVQGVQGAAEDGIDGLPGPVAGGMKTVAGVVSGSPNTGVTGGATERAMAGAPRVAAASALPSGFTPDSTSTEQAEVADNAAKTAPAPIEVLEDRRREFKRARAQWVAVKKRAEADLELVKAGAHKVYRADADQYPKVVAGCKAIDAILDNLDDELRDTLDRYAATPLRAQGQLADLAESATAVLDRYQQYVDADPVMRAIDQKEFADVVVHAPVSKALLDLRKALS